VCANDIGANSPIVIKAQCQRVPSVSNNYQPHSLFVTLGKVEDLISDGLQQCYCLPAAWLLLILLILNERNSW
jgi:hypothetical protein